MSGVTGVDISFHLQHGLVRDSITINAAHLTLKTLKDEACNFIDTKFPEHNLQKLNERLLLFRHVYDTPNILQMINSASEVTQDTLVEIVMSGLVPPNDEDVIRPHSLLVHSYKSPTFCDFCGELLFGLVRQGLKCEGCGLNFHKRCAYKIPNNCSHARTRRASMQPPLPPSIGGSSASLYPESVGGSDASRDGSMGSLVAATASLDTQDGGVPGSTSSASSPSMKSRGGSVSSGAGRPLWVEKELAGRIKVPHSFALHSYTKPTMCHYCKKLLKGLFKQGFQCKDCRYNTHRKCMERVPHDCLGEAPDSGGVAGSQSDDEEGNEGTTGGYHYDSGDNDDDSPPSPAPPHRTAPDASDNGIESSNIPLMRIVQSIKHQKRISKVCKEGWMVHFTNKDPTRKRHYWRLDTKSITLYPNDSTQSYYKDIHLAEILNIQPAKFRTAQDDKNGLIHCFELVTANLNLFVGQEAYPPNKEGGAPEVNPPESGLGAYLARGWEQEIRNALQPVTPKTSVSIPPLIISSVSTPFVVVSSPAGPPVSSQTASAAFRQDVQIDPEEAVCKDISQLYQIFTDEVLGSGQFGTVYGAVHRKSSREVAVKMVDKLRFPNKQKSALKNELAILQSIRHQGVVNVERMFETPDRIFVVMEKLRGDMLEMILSSERGRLTERVTKYLINQILIALRYLHSKNIVHCDLKPENVLLSDNSDYPQVKLCDFGFARIIGEKSFRKSVVGTPAYLAPEVLRNKGYNRSLDMWSVGVVTYVSLSGTFPFNEDEDINDQITNAGFMYPPNPWKEITQDAIDLISNLLQVNKRKRLTVEKSLEHIWLQDFQLWTDLRELEDRVGSRFLTHESDDERWNTLRPPPASSHGGTRHTNGKGDSNTNNNNNSSSDTKDGTTRQS